MNPADSGGGGSAGQDLTAPVTRGDLHPTTTPRGKRCLERTEARQALVLAQGGEIHTEICGFAASVTHFHQEVKCFSDILKIVFWAHLAIYLV